METFPLGSVCYGKADIACLHLYPPARLATVICGPAERVPPDHHVGRHGPDGGWKSAATADRTRASAAGERMPTDLTMRPAPAVKSLPGRAKLATSKPPDAKSVASSGTAEGSP